MAPPAVVIDHSYLILLRIRLARDDKTEAVTVVDETESEEQSVLYELTVCRCDGTMFTILSGGYQSCL